jgi:hypothetical protein
VRKNLPQPKAPRKPMTVGYHSPAGKSIPGRSPATTMITLRGDDCDPQYIIQMINRQCPRKKALSIKSSLRWIDTYKTPNGGLRVPYIDELGRITGHTLYKWSCDPRSLIASVISTVSKRLLKYCLKHNIHRVVKRFLPSIVGAAAYYVFTKDSHFWDRILFFSRNLEKRGTLIHRLRLFFSSKWSDHKRFVISQVIFQTHWLLSRGKSPRDKLQFFKERSRTLWRKPEDSPSRLEITNTIRDLAYAISSI